MYNKKKALTLLLFLSLIIIFSASALAAVPGPGEILSDIGDFLRDLLGSSSNLDGNNPSVLAGMRIIWFLLVFTVLYAGGRALQNVAALAQVYNHRIIVVLALLLSAMTLLVTPPTFLIGLAEVYGSIIITVFYGGALAGVVYAIWRMPNNSWLWNLAKIALLILLWVVVHEVSTWVLGGI